jgi:transcriptional regulator with XRE-family HTH domain
MITPPRTTYCIVRIGHFNHITINGSCQHSFWTFLLKVIVANCPKLVYNKTQQIERGVGFKMSEYEVGLYKIIGEMLREIRAERDFTLDQIADKLEVTAKTVQRYEKGERKIKINTLIELSNILGFDYNKFMAEAKNKLANSSNSSESNISTIMNDPTYEEMIDIYTRGKNNLTPQEKMRLAQIILSDEEE